MSKTKVTLILKDLIVDGKHIDYLEIEWELDLTQKEVFDLSRKWIDSRHFLREMIKGIERVTNSQMIIEPM